MKNILIIEDDWKLNNGIKLALRNPEYVFFQSKTISQAREIRKSEQIDLILLDVNLPDGNGMDYLEEIRKKSDIPIIIITANNMEMDIVTGLELGANDYITKPFSLMVLRARVDVQLREKRTESKIYESEEFSFDFDKMLFKVRGNVIELSKTEQKLLFYLIQSKGTTVTRSKLIDEVWSGEVEFVEEHALTVAIKRLRDKIEKDSSCPEYIKTVYGIGYTWELGE
ncbi:MAG: response regulator transcription factor [Lachnospiraceae bacterium]|nr:response regulator transcription factor [Lachnospiraceae bacterium]